MRYNELTEAAREYALYHGTSIDALSQIIKENSLHNDFNSDGMGGSVSMSSSFDVAAGFAKNGEDHVNDIMSDDYDHSGGERIGAVLEFSSVDLRKNFGLRRVRWDGDGSEKEMRTLEDITPFDRHVKKIYLRKSDVEEYISVIDEQPYLDIFKSLLTDARITWI